MAAKAYLRAESEPEAPPPLGATGVIAFARENLFSSPLNIALTFAALAALFWVSPFFYRFLIADAVWSAPDGAACRAPGAGACWAFVSAKLPFFIYGAYPEAQRWRINAVFVLFGALLIWTLWPKAPQRHIGVALFFTLFPFAAFVLSHGAPWLRLPIVSTDYWGGAVVTCLIAVSGIVFSLPLGVVLALGRRSEAPLIRMLSIGFIELMRGVPLVAILFMANHMLPLFLPEALTPDRLLRPLIGVALFAAAYMAEVVRGGLQAIPRGQTEAAQALGLSYWRRMILIILPQALRIVVPGIASTFIGLFKDTTLVAVVGIFDFLYAIEIARADVAWASPTTMAAGYLFAALCYFFICFSISLYSKKLEAPQAAVG